MPPWRYKKECRGRVRLCGAGEGATGNGDSSQKPLLKKKTKDDDDDDDDDDGLGLGMLATSTTAGDAVAVGGDAGVLVCSVLCPQREDARASDGGDKGLISNSTKAPPAAAAARMISKNK